MNENRKFWKVADHRKIDSDFVSNEISYSRMVEIINEKAEEHYKDIAREEACAFLEWTAVNDWIYSSDSFWYYMSDGNPRKGITESELFDIYQQQKLK